MNQHANNRQDGNNDFTKPTEKKFVPKKLQLNSKRTKPPSHAHYTTQKTEISNNCN